MRCAVRTGGSVPRGIGSRRSSEGSRSIVCPAGISSSDAGTDSDASPGTMKCESGRPRCSRRTCSAMLVCGPTFIRSSSTYDMTGSTGMARAVAMQRARRRRRIFCGTGVRGVELPYQD